MELYQEMSYYEDLLMKAISELKERGRNYAKAYKEYRMLLAKELLELRANEMPVTIAYDIARGKEEIANAKEQEIITESLYKSCQEAINVYKLKIKILENQISREFGVADKI